MGNHYMYFRVPRNTAEHVLFLESIHSKFNNHEESLHIVMPVH